MLGLGFHRYQRSPWELLLSSLVSCFLVLFSQFALVTIPRGFPSLSLLAMLPIAVLVWGVTIALGRCLRWILGVSASAPALVLFNILFLWGVYVVMIRQAIPSLLDAIFNAECALLLFGLYRILSGDPGVVSSVTLEESDISGAELQYEDPTLLSRIRYCKSCKASIRGFDHHCPAFGTCIGQKNHRLFMGLVTGFVITEASYTMCSTKFITKLLDGENIGFERSLSNFLVISTTLFSVLQLLWQVAFLVWHIGCICLNIRTDEFVNWKRYPEFQIVDTGSPFSEVRFTNPFNKGLFSNIKEFMKSKE